MFSIRRLIWIAAPVLLYRMMMEITGYFVYGIPAGRISPVLLNVAVSAAASLPFLIVMWRKDAAEHERPLKGLRQFGQKTNFIVLLAGMLLMGMACAALLQWTGRQIEIFLPGITGASGELFSGFAVQTQQMLTPLWAGALVLLVLAPLVEELVYRGLFYGRLRDILPAWPAAVVCAGCFALGHGNTAQTLYAFLMGMALSGIRERGENLWFPAAFHIGANLFSLLTYMAG